MSKSILYYSGALGLAAVVFIIAIQSFQVHSTKSPIDMGIISSTTSLLATSTDTSATSTEVVLPKPVVHRTPPVSRPRDENGVPYEEGASADVPIADTSCIVGGCSGQLCLSKNEGGMATTCEWREVYACYQTATCEQQADGQCGWTKDEELTQCLVEKENL